MEKNKGLVLGSVLSGLMIIGKVLSLTAAPLIVCVAPAAVGLAGLIANTILEDRKSGKENRKHNDSVRR